MNRSTLVAAALAALLFLPGCGSDPAIVPEGPEPSRARAPRRTGEAPPYIRETGSVPASTPADDDEDRRRDPPHGAPRGPVEPPGHVSPLERP